MATPVIARGNAAVKPPAAAQIVLRRTSPGGTAGAIDSLARGFGTDRKTLLLVGLAGLVGGYLLNDGIKATRRLLHRSARRTRSLAATVFTPRNVIIATTAGLGLGAAYWYYKKHTTATPAAYLPAKPAPRLQLPVRPS